MTDPTVLLIWADGLSSRYLNELDTPLLSKFAVGSRQATLQSMFGYLSVGGAVFCGLQPGRSRLLWEFGRREAPASVGSALRAVLSVVDHVPNDRARFLLRLGILRSLGTEYLGLANAIPHDLLWYFQPRLSSQLEHRPRVGEGVNTIFDWLVGAGMAYEYSRPPPADEGSAAASLISRIRKGQLPNLFVYHPVSLDVTGHKSGPRGAATKRAIARFDRTTGRILSAIEHSPAKILCITMSDHGMQPIENLFDSQSRIRRLPLRIGKDYLYFMDSTMIRFWFETASAEDIIRSDFSGPGRFLTQRDLEAAAIGKPDRFYGDLFFAIEQGWAVYPDFFRRTHRPRGMHGYYRQTYDTPVAIVGGSPGLSPRFTVPEGNHTDICRTMADFLGLKAPFEMDGKPIVEYS